MRKGSSKCRVSPIIAPFHDGIVNTYCTRTRLAKHLYSSRYRMAKQRHVQIMILPSSFVIMGADGLRLLF
jgi:hypothetical protein